MRYLMLALALTACESLDHFTEPPKEGKTITVDCRDPHLYPEPLPPGSRPDTSITCTLGE